MTAKAPEPYVSIAGIAPDFTEGIESAQYVKDRWSRPAPPIMTDKAPCLPGCVPSFGLHDLGCPNAEPKPAPPIDPEPKVFGTVKEMAEAWEKKSTELLRGIKESERITAADLAVRINAKADATAAPIDYEVADRWARNEQGMSTAGNAYLALREENAALKALAEAAEAQVVSVLEEAVEDISSWASYASDYFQTKHDLAGTLAKYHGAILSARQEGKS